MKELTSVEQYEEIKRLSNNQPIFIMKHSTRCSRSASAYEEVGRFSTAQATSQANGAPIYILDLLAHRDVSNLIEQDTGIQHESPQIFLFLNGTVVWEAHHWEVKEENLSSALESYTQASN